MVRPVQIVARIIAVDVGTSAVANGHHQKLCPAASPLSMCQSPWLTTRRPLLRAVGCLKDRFDAPGVFVLPD